MLLQRLQEPRRFIQVLAGARQTGKTTLVLQVLEAFKGRCHYTTADEPALKGLSWIEQQWEVGRSLAASGEPAILVLDEAQKIVGWSETIKRLWDEDTARHLSLQVVLLGSAPLLVQTGLSESLTGRFEIIRVPHWSFQEMREAFGWSVDQFVFFGGYPGSAPLIADPHRWRRYVLDSLIETTISRDILLMRRVDKPALLRRLFELGCQYSGQVLSYTKMLGQLVEAGNTSTLSHYLELLQAAGLIQGLPKYSGQTLRQKSSSPKLQVCNTALITAQSDRTFDRARQDPSYWGRLVESAAGAWLVNAAQGSTVRVFYWSAKDREVDFVLAKGDQLVAIEVKGGYDRGRLAGMDAFSKLFPVHRKLLVGPEGIPLEQFIQTPLEKWFS